MLSFKKTLVNKILAGVFDYQRAVIINVSGLIILGFGCAPPKVSQIDLPYDTLHQFSISGDRVQPDEWWTSFNDQNLNLLIDTALRQNQSLQGVWQQLEQSRAVVDIAKSNLLPDIDLLLQSGISRPEPDFVGGENTQLSLGADYEADLWGRIRYSMHAEQYRM
ncbi:MAG: TolC family protein, partial [Fulvivirga sp.]|nr:TolC family protein [Fulvivirga sp.]